MFIIFLIVSPTGGPSRLPTSCLSRDNSVGLPRTSSDAFLNGSANDSPQLSTVVPATFVPLGTSIPNASGDSAIGNAFSIDEFLTLPAIPKPKTQRKQAILPCSISGHAYQEMLKTKKMKADEELKLKETRKKEREEKKELRLRQAAEKKRMSEERKRQREQARNEKEKEKEVKKRAKLKAKKEKVSVDLHVHDDEIQDVTDLCKGCKSSTRGTVRIKCTLCDKLWHAPCVKNMDLTKVSTQESLDAMRIELMCCIENLIAV